MSYTNISNLGMEHKEWLSSLDFYQIELNLLKKG